MFRNRSAVFAPPILSATIRRHLAKRPPGRLPTDTAAAGMLLRRGLIALRPDNFDHLSFLFTQPRRPVEQKELAKPGDECLTKSENTVRSRTCRSAERA